jgi:murein DD-endopeptidase MepM/ murein hydrolase activator NlpD
LLGSLERSLGAGETAQLRLLHGLRLRSHGEASRLRAVIASLGLAADRLEAPAAAGGMGGPYVPLPLSSGASPFETAAAEVYKSLTELARLRHASAALPLGRPAIQYAELTSGFGMRIDPFTRGPAMHTGLDFRAERGAEVRATGPGRVTAAEYSGGYGRMVEVDHGNGVATRYAHFVGNRRRARRDRRRRRDPRSSRLERTLDRPPSSLRGADRRRAD